jgi:hypothetical protein
MQKVICGSMDYAIAVVGVATLGNILSIIYNIYKINTMSEEKREKERHKLIYEMLDDEKFKATINDAVKHGIEESELNKQVQKLVFILCQNVQEIKKTKLCE